jgi:putative protease
VLDQVFVKRNIELLAPGGDINSIKAAIAADADAVYCGLNKFNARNRAANISLDDLNGILRLAHQNNCKVFLTLNIIVVDSEIPVLIGILNKLVNTSIDGIIVQDLGLFYLISRYFKGLKIHASTQLTTHNKGQILFLSKLNATRVNLSRELNINEIKSLSQIGHQNHILIEMFVHGSHCICFSGICYISSVLGGNSGNRGRCSQPCRDQYLTTPEGKNFPLNLKDISTYNDLREIADAGVDSLKIEGRTKMFHYVYMVVNSWKKQVRSFYDQNKLNNDNSDLYKVFNRAFSNGFLKGNISKDMFIENPRNNSANYLSETYNGSYEENIEKAKGDVFEVRNEIIAEVEAKIKHLSIAKVPLIISISGENGMPLRVSVKTPDISFVVRSEINLKVGKQELNREMILSRLKAINDTEYHIEHLNLENLQKGLFLPFKELTLIKKRLLFILNGSREYVESIAVPVLNKQSKENIKATLSVLISSEKDLYLCNETAANIYFQVPDSFKNESADLANLFIQNKKIIPWFPSVLIGEDYGAAVEFLQKVQARHIVTNNTGIAYEAYKKGIPWIAGPYLNIVNSYSLLCFKENFNCCGSFISNEISRVQIKGIKKPDDFDLYYSIYHPVLLMTSRQCLFQQVTGCEKNTIEDSCMQQCNRTSTITNLKNNILFIEKSKGNYHKIYHDANYLNTDIVNDIQNLFSGFFIDLRDIKTVTKTELNKAGLIKIFENLINKIPDSKKDFEGIIYPTIKEQYYRGI